MKRFMLYGGDSYYPSGGAQDFIASFDTREEVDAHVRTRLREEWEISSCHWANVMDTATRGVEDLDLPKLFGEEG